MTARLRALLGVLAVFLSVHRGAAQVAVDAMLSAGTGHGGEYYARELAGRRLAVSWRFCGAGRESCPFAEVGFDDLGWNREVTLVCIPSTSGGCVPPFPSLAGTSLNVGYLISGSPWFALRTELGIGRFSGGSHAYLGQVDGAFFPFTGISRLDGAFKPLGHVAITMGGRRIVVPNYRGNYLSQSPMTLGLRVR